MTVNTALPKASALDPQPRVRRVWAEHAPFLLSRRSPTRQSIPPFVFSPPVSFCERTGARTVRSVPKDAVILGSGAGSPGAASDDLSLLVAAIDRLCRVCGGFLVAAFAGHSGCRRHAATRKLPQTLQVKWYAFVHKVIASPVLGSLSRRYSQSRRCTAAARSISLTQRLS